MSSLSNPTAAFKQQFHDAFNEQLQQRESRLQGTVLDRGQISGSSFTINNLGATEMEPVNNRYEDKHLGGVDNSTRVVYMQDFDRLLAVDGFDIPKLAADPTYRYPGLLVSAANRRRDKTIYRALLDPVLQKTGESGPLTSVSLPSSQIILAGGTGFTKAKAIFVRSLFRKNEADQESDLNEEIFILYDSNMVRQILSDTTLTSGDYMSVRMLQDGAIAKNWMGMTWIPYEKLDPGAGGATERRTVAYAKSAVEFGTGIETKTEVGQNKQKRGHPIEAYAWMSIGAGRADENKVAAIDFVANA
ncbi:phage capsid protein [Eleftheria terrae]|uniref:phage capsid protein n=1 Tax=Eleftheria terrae TaxID=1597781 RepID=UPI00263BDF25|nr:phage capsid protein [Eleftheria terrae]WKB53017.1 phage capsid protein [Eleftheria terrae]